MKKIAIGIDIGGTNTAFGAVDEEGCVCAESNLSTRRYPLLDDYPDYVADLTAAIRTLLGSLPFPFETAGIGIGAPNGYYRTGAIEQPVNLWKFRPGEIDRDERRRIFPLADELSAAFDGIPVRMTNDANASTIGEMIFGNARGMRDFIVVTLGTGLGSGFVANGELVCGHDGFAGELGHVVVEPGGRCCGCGRRGCLETYVSATGICRTALELMAELNEPSTLRGIAPQELDARMISEAAEAGDPIAVECFRRTGERLGRALADAVTITSPEAILLFGGLAKAGAKLFDPTRAAMEAHMMYPFRNKVKLLPSGIRATNAAIPGAAALIWKELRG